MQQNSNPGTKWGLIAGLVLIVLNVATWAAGYQVLFSLWNSILQMVIFILLAVIAGLEKKKQLGGYIGFKDALKPVFSTFVIGSILLSLYQYILYKYIDPNVVNGLKQSMAASTEFVLRFFKAPQQEIDNQLDALKAADFKISFARSFMDLMKSVIFYFVVAAILSAIIRRKAPDTV